jgi:uncharacterized protein YidB (DUF937 family)
MDLGDLSKNLLGGGKGIPGVDKLLPVITGALAGGKLGALDDVLGKFGAAGLGDKVQSWISNGQNEEVSGDDVENALGADTIDDLAKEAGVSKDEAKGGLASILPGIVDKLTPGGKAPSGGFGDVAGQLGGLLKGFGK